MNFDEVIQAMKFYRLIWFGEKKLHSNHEILKTDLVRRKKIAIATKMKVVYSKKKISDVATKPTVFNFLDTEKKQDRATNRTPDLRVKRQLLFLQANGQQSGTC